MGENENMYKETFWNVWLSCLYAVSSIPVLLLFLQFYLNMLSFFKTIIFEIYTLIKETGYKYASPRG